MSFLGRITRRLNRVGEQFTVGGNTYRGVFRALDSGTMRVYLDDVEIMGVTRPGLLLITTPGSVIAASDTITRDGRTYTVLKTTIERIAGVPVSRIVILG